MQILVENHVRYVDPRLEQVNILIFILTILTIEFLLNFVFIYNNFTECKRLGKALITLSSGYFLLAYVHLRRRKKKTILKPRAKNQQKPKNSQKIGRNVP